MLLGNFSHTLGYGSYMQLDTVLVRRQLDTESLLSFHKNGVIPLIETCH